MKPTRSILCSSVLLVFTALLIFTVSCKKSNSSSSSSSAMSGKLGDSTFTATNNLSFYSQSGGNILVNGLLRLTATDSVCMELSFDYPVQTNVLVNMDSTDNSIDLFDFNRATQNWNTCFSSLNPPSSSGYYKITTFDTVHHQIAGIFYGTLYESNVLNDSTVLSNGQFNVTYIVVP